MRIWADPGGTGGPDPLKITKIGFLNNTDPDPLKNHKATCTKPEFNVGPSFKWRFAGGPMMTRLAWYLDPSSPSSTKKTTNPPPPPVKIGPPLTKLSGSAHGEINLGHAEIRE